MYSTLYYFIIIIITTSTTTTNKPWLGRKSNARHSEEIVYQMRFKTESKYFCDSRILKFVFFSFFSTKNTYIHMQTVCFKLFFFLQKCIQILLSRPSVKDTKKNGLYNGFNNNTKEKQKHNLIACHTNSYTQCCMPINVGVCMCVCRCAQQVHVSYIN